MARHIFRLGKAAASASSKTLASQTSFVSLSFRTCLQLGTADGHLWCLTPHVRRPGSLWNWVQRWSVRSPRWVALPRAARHAALDATLTKTMVPSACACQTASSSCCHVRWCAAMTRRRRRSTNGRASGRRTPPLSRRISALRRSTSSATTRCRSPGRMASTRSSRMSCLTACGDWQSPGAWSPPALQPPLFQQVSGASRQLQTWMMRDVGVITKYICEDDV
mmetsp:Transcript_23435/g.69619  ORF Transcript_23435/g.69619 Transcript_23435/m.69619 type:complete len:222 (-) Transcript_23435:72-737(-)